LLASVPEERRGECWWLVDRDRTPYPGDAGGAAELLAELRLTRPLGVALRRTGASGLVDALDRTVARRRARLGRFVPDGPALRRYP
jgi:hypothetical protein